MLLKRSRREYLSPELQLAMTLKYLAHGGSFLNLSWEFRVGQSTVSKVIRQTCLALWNVLAPIYLSVPKEKDWIKISNRFWEKWQFPNTLGAIDGKHVAIQSPCKSGSEFYNYKNYFSIVLLACCDADYKFLWVDIGAYGSENDAGIFRRSKMGEDLEKSSVKLQPKKLPGSDTKMPYYFLGDEGFPLKEYLMRPYPGKYLDEKKRCFNYRLSRGRRTIENAFGILASRWRVYRAPLLCSVETTEAIVQATVCLHNYLISEASKEYSPGSLYDAELNNGETIEGQWRTITKNDNNLRSVGRIGSNVSAKTVYEQRDRLASYLVSASGAVPWQKQIVNRE